VSEISREKLLEVVQTRIPKDAADELDAFVREREAEARLPLSRSLGVREILVEWARCRAANRASKEKMG
jgi:hypothetical protein